MSYKIENVDLVELFEEYDFVAKKGRDADTIKRLVDFYTDREHRDDDKVFKYLVLFERSKDWIMRTPRISGFDPDGDNKYFYTELVNCYDRLSQLCLWRGLPNLSEKYMKKLRNARILLEDNIKLDCTPSPSSSG